MLLLRRIILKEIKIARGILQFYYKTLKPLEINAAILYHYYARIATGGVLSPDAPKKYRRNTMKNISRILALVLALTMVIGAFASVSAAKATWYNSAVSYLKNIGVADVGLKAEEKVTRAEFALMIAKIDSTWVNTEWWDENGVLADTVVFKDQADTDKAHRAAICYAYQRNLIAGDGDGNFRPNATITLAEASVIVVRLMGFQNDVPENGDQWQYNWMYTANKFCHAFDTTFMSNVNTVNPKYELSYGEAAYLLATILNWGNTSDDVTCLTKKGENLGKNFGRVNTSADLVRVKAVDMIKETLITSSTVTVETIMSTGEAGEEVVLDTEELERLVRVSLGLSATRDLASDDKFNLGDYIQNGTIFQLSRKDGNNVAVTLFSGNTKAVSDTILVATAGPAHTYNYDGTIKTVGDYPKFANKAGKADATPQLPASYTSATYEVNGEKKYTYEISFSGNKLVFKGGSESAVEYTIVSNLNTIDAQELVVYDSTFTMLTAAQVKAAIPNVANGGARVEFYDIDADGYYDIAVVAKTEKFTSTPTVSFDNDKVTLSTYGNASTDKAYRTIQIGTVSAGVIVAVDTSGFKTIGGKKYYTATVATIGNAEETKTVYIPVPAKDENGDETYANRPATVKITYTVEGLKATATVDSTKWTSFLDINTTGTVNDVLDAEEFKGIVYNKAVKYVLAGDLDSSLTGDAANVVVYVTDTAAENATANGFIVKVEKSETGDNTFNVTLAVTNEYEGGGVHYFDNALDARFCYVARFGSTRVLNQTTVDKGGANAPWTNDSITIRDALTTLGFDAEKYSKANHTWVYEIPECDPAKVDKGQTTWNLSVTEMNGNLVAYTRNLLTALKATAADMDAIYGKTLAALDKQLDDTVVDFETAISKNTVGWCILYNYEVAQGKWPNGKMPDYEKDADGAYVKDADGNYVQKKDEKGNLLTTIAYPDDYAAAKKTYEEVTLGQILDTFAKYDDVQTFDKKVFFENVVANKNNVRTNVAYGYMVQLLDGIIASGRFERAVFEVKSDTGTANNGWSKTGNASVTVQGQTSYNEEGPKYKYLDAVISHPGSTGVKTYEVRASASVLWDIANVGMYNRIFATNENAYHPQDETSKTYVNPHDLVYVSILDDASGQYVLKYDADAYKNVTSEGFVKTDHISLPYAVKRVDGVEIAAGNCGFSSEHYSHKGRYAFKRSTDSPADNWKAYNEVIFIDAINTKTVEAAGKAAIKAGATDYTTTATIKVARAPYYAKTNGTAKFVKHWFVADLTVTFKVTQDTTEGMLTYVPVVDQTGAQVKVLTEAEKAEWESMTAPDGMKYRVIDKLLYRVNTNATPVRKWDADGNPIVSVKTEYDVTSIAEEAWVDTVVSNDDLAKVHTVTTRELDIVNDKDVYPYGEYEVKFDGTTYYAFGDATVIVMTPNPVTGNLDGTTTTLAKFIEAKKDLFVTYEQVYATTADGHKILKALTVIGEYTDGIKKDDDTTKPETKKTVTVYLGKSGATLEATEFGKEVVVKSTYSAVSVPSGESFGSIYRTYSTYAEAAFAASISTGMPAGYYVVSEDGKIETTGVSTKVGYITSTDANGGVKAKIDGKEVDATSFKWAFFYTDFDGNFKKAGDSTSVSLVSPSVIENNIKTKEEAVAKAQDAYDAIDSKYVAAKAAAQEALVKAKQALEDYKASVVTKYYDGQFWGFANSPAYTFALKYEYGYQQKAPAIYFEYIVVDGTYCVLSNTILGDQ